MASRKGRATSPFNKTVAWHDRSDELLKQTGGESVGSERRGKIITTTQTLAWTRWVVYCQEQQLSGGNKIILTPSERVPSSCGTHYLLTKFN